MALRVIAAASIGIALLAAPAVAQQPPAAGVVKSPEDLSVAQMTELYCVYDGMRKDKDAGAASRALGAGGTADDKAKAKAVFDKSKAACTAQHKWAPEQERLAGVVATNGTLTDVFEKELRARSFTDKQFELVLSVVDRMSPEDARAMIAFNSKSADAFVDRIRKMIIDGGATKDKAEADMAFTFLQATMAEYDAATQWVAKGFY
jgi:hypothetical protein